MYKVLVKSMPVTVNGTTSHILIFGSGGGIRDRIGPYTMSSAGGTTM